MRNSQTLLILAIIMTSCSTTPPIRPDTTFVESVKIGKKADAVDASAKTLRNNKDKPTVVVGEADKLNVVAKELRQDDKTVSDMQAKIIHLQDELKKTKEHYESAVTKSRQNMYATATWIGGGLALIGAICLVAAIKISALASIGAGFAFLGVALISSVQFLTTYDWAPLAIGMVCVFGVIAFVVWLFIKKHQERQAELEEVEELWQGNIDLAKSIEMLKPNLTDKDYMMKTIAKIQSPKTQEFVAEIKKTEINNQA